MPLILTRRLPSVKKKMDTTAGSDLFSQETPEEVGK